jgi:hypothetical protein
LALVALGPHPPHLLTSDDFLIRPEHDFLPISPQFSKQIPTVNNRCVTWRLRRGVNHLEMFLPFLQRQHESDVRFVHSGLECLQMIVPQNTLDYYIEHLEYGL